MPVHEIVLLAETDVGTGLSGVVAGEQLALPGLNRLPERRDPRRLRARAVPQPLIQVLLGAAALTAALGETMDASVVLEERDQVPADLRIVRTRELRVDESALTGEAQSSARDPLPVLHDTALASCTNMAYSGMLVTTGGGRGVWSPPEFTSQRRFMATRHTGGVMYAKGAVERISELTDSTDH